MWKKAAGLVEHQAVRYTVIVWSCRQNPLARRGVILSRTRITDTVTASMARFFLFLPIGILAISTGSIFVKLCPLPSLSIAAWRLVLASLFLLPAAGYRRIWTGWERTDLGWFALSGFLLALHFASWIASLKYTSVASSVVLVNCHPVFVGLGAWLFLKERPDRKIASGIVLSVVGAGLIGYGDMAGSSGALAGDGLALVGAMAATGYFLVGRKMRGHQGLLSYIFPVYGTAGLVLLLCALLSGQPLSGFAPSDYLFLVLLALVPQLIGHTTFNWALKHLPASMVAVAALGEPVGSSILAFFVLGEGLTAWKAIGGLAILAGIAITLWKKPGTP
jgi:drug/metabolite transporter (DMT)-like permease